MRRDVDVARLQQPRPLVLRHSSDPPDPVVETMALDLGVELRLVRTVANQQELHGRHLGADIRNRRRQHVDAVPPAEGAGKAHDEVIIAEPQRPAEAALVIARAGA